MEGSDSHFFPPLNAAVDVLTSCPHSRLWHHLPGNRVRCNVCGSEMRDYASTREQHLQSQRHVDATQVQVIELPREPSATPEPAAATQDTDVEGYELEMES